MNFCNLPDDWPYWDELTRRTGRRRGNLPIIAERGCERSEVKNAQLNIMRTVKFDQEIERVKSQLFHDYQMSGYGGKPYVTQQAIIEYLLGVRPTVMVSGHELTPFKNRPALEEVSRKLKI